MKPALAIDDKHTPFSHVAFAWDADQGSWYFLCAGRTPEEFQTRRETWIGRGIDPAIIQQYACQPVTATEPQATLPLQAIEGESWGDWVGRLRAAQNRLTIASIDGTQISVSAAPEPQPQPAERETPTEWTTRARAAQAKLVQNAACQPVPINCELLNAISKQRPQAYFLLQKYNVLNAIITVGTSRTKLEFPTCPPLGHGGHDWSQFDRDNMHPHRPIIVLDGTPDTGFKRSSLRYPNGQ